MIVTVFYQTSQAGSGQLHFNKDLGSFGEKKKIFSKIKLPWLKFLFLQSLAFGEN